MRKPDPKKLLGLPAEARRYIAELESENKIFDEAINRMHHRCDSLIKQVRDLQCGHTERQEPTKLDQFAMAALPVAQKTCEQISIKSAAQILSITAAEFNNEHALKLLSKYAYDIAEAMQAESKKRQGGGV